MMELLELFVILGRTNELTVPVSMIVRFIPFDQPPILIRFNDPYLGQARELGHPVQWDVLFPARPRPVKGYFIWDLEPFIRTGSGENLPRPTND